MSMTTRPRILSRYDRAGPIERAIERNDLAHRVDRVGIEIPRDARPGLSAQGDARTHAFDSEQRNAAKDERRDIRGKLHAPDIAAGGDRAVEARLRKKVGESDAADGVHADGEALRLQGLSWGGEFFARNDLGRAQTFQIILFAGASRNGGDAPASLGEQRDRERADAPRRARHHRESVLRPRAMALQRKHAEQSGQSRGADRHGARRRQRRRQFREPIAR